MTSDSSGVRRLEPRDDRWARTFVWLVWAGMMLIVLVSFSRNARNVPLAEDWLLVPMLTGHESEPLSWLWAQNNEHRIPLPKAMLVAMLRLAGGDFRFPMLFNIALIGAAAAALMIVVRRVRGRARFTDAFFPLLLLHLGNWENLFWGWQLTQILPTLLALALLMVFVAQPGLHRPGAAGVAALALVALPLCGANGLLFMPLPASWMAYRGVAALRRNHRGIGITLAGAVLLTVLLTAFYFVGYRSPEWTHPNPGIVPSLAVALQFLAFGLGPGVQRLWGPAAAFASCTMLVTAAVLVRAALAGRGLQRQHAVAVLIFAATIGGFVFAMGWGRAGALDVFGYWPLRYALMAAPAFCLAYFAFDLFGSRLVRRVGPAVLFVAAVLLVPWNTLEGWEWRNWYGGEAAALDRELSAGRSAHDIAVRRGEFLIHWWDPDTLVTAMWMMHDAGLAPFSRLNRDATALPGDSAMVERTALDARGRALIAHEVEYRLPSAGEVWIAWGVNGWLPLVDSLRPPGTAIRRRVMRTPLVRTPTGFHATLLIPAGDTVDYGFLTTKRADGLGVRQLWDRQPGFTFVASRDTSISVAGSVRLESEKSRDIWPWVLGSLAVLAAVSAGASARARRNPGRA